MLNPSVCLSVRQSVNGGMIGSVCVCFFGRVWFGNLSRRLRMVFGMEWNGVVELSRIEYLAFEHFTKTPSLSLIIHIIRSFCLLIFASFTFCLFSSS
jgi:hypothetical protein